MSTAALLACAQVTLDIASVMTRELVPVVAEADAVAVPLADCGDEEAVALVVALPLREAEAVNWELGVLLVLFDRIEAVGTAERVAVGV